jgi:triosephosphate isomerase
MDKTKRKAIIAGNWKMNKTPNEAKALLAEIIPAVKDADCEVIACVPYVDLSVALEATQGTNVKIGAENCHWAESGAFTGEVSAPMLKAIGVEYVIIGHSERRQYFGETDETVNKRVRAALDSGLTVILCVGELLDERKKGVTMEVVRSQTKIALQGVSNEELDRIIIAYEPVWAIGTGETATAEQADEVNHAIREVLGEIYCPKCASRVTIQYGGSMNAKNAAELLAKVDVDGGLIGGASLKAEDFSVIVKAASI